MVVGAAIYNVPAETLVLSIAFYELLLKLASNGKEVGGNV